MRGRLIRLLLRLAALSVVVWAGRRALIRWIDGPALAPSTAPWPPVGEPAVDAGSAAEVATTVGATAAAAAEAEPPAERDAPAAAATTMQTEAAAGDGATEAWLVPDGAGACPATHLVKAKVSTRLYRLPGTAAYDRATPDRCYVSAEAAEADGFTRAKR